MNCPSLVKLHVTPYWFFFLIKFFKYVPQCFVSLLLDDANWFAIHTQILL